MAELEKINPERKAEIEFALGELAVVCKKAQINIGIANAETKPELCVIDETSNRWYPIKHVSIPGGN